MEQDYPFYHGGLLVARTLKEHGVNYAFGVHGGHVWSLERGFFDFGLERLHMRHEQAAAYAADAYARCTRTPSVFYATNGPGMTNTVSGLAQSWWSNSPVIALFGQHVHDLNGRQTIQEAYAEDMCRGITKWTVVNEDWRMITYYLQKALYDCMVEPRGPIAIANTPKALLIPGTQDVLVGDVPAVDNPLPRSGGCYKAAEEVVQMLCAAERPMIVAGESLYWDSAGSELKELIELTNCPVNLRRGARGLVPGDHGLVVNSAYRGRFWKDCDLLLILGLRLGFLEAFGEPPAYPAGAERVVVNGCASDAWAPLPCKTRVTANVGEFVHDMLVAMKARGKPAPARTQWLGWLRTCREEYQTWVALNVKEYANHQPVHPFVLGKEIGDFLDPDATVILDSFTGSAYLTDHLRVRFGGHVLDSGPWAGVGHGIGMGIGAQVARPGKQVLVMMGDGGMGVGAMDIETALRYKLPVVYVVFNNSEWLSGVRENLFRDQVYHWGMLPDIRYDKMFEAMGCHGENVTKSEEIRPALFRAFESGTTAVVNVMVEQRVYNHLIETAAIRGMVRLLADRKKVEPEWWEWLEKGATPQVVEKLRAKGYPMLLSSKAIFRAEQPLYKRATK